MMDQHDHEGRERRESGAFKVVDRRRFTATGDVRADAPPDAGPRAASPIVQKAPEPPAQTRPNAPAAAPAPHDAAGPADAASEPPAGQAASAPRKSASSVDFLSFVGSLATNAMAAMGLLPPSQSRGMPQSLDMAREYIDIIVMLQERTQGNVSPEENEALTQLISDLGQQYVALQRKDAAMIKPPM